MLKGIGVITSNLQLSFWWSHNVEARFPSTYELLLSINRLEVGPKKPPKAENRNQADDNPYLAPWHHFFFDCTPIALDSSKTPRSPRSERAFRRCRRSEFSLLAPKEAK